MKEDTLLEIVLRTKVALTRRREKKRGHHAHAAEDDEPSTKRIRQESDYSSSEE